MIARDQRFDLEIFFRQYFQIVERARNHSGNDDIVYVLHCETFEHQQLVKPHGIFVGCPPGVCGNPPARANLTAFHQGKNDVGRSEEHTSELQSLMRISYAVFCLKKKIKKKLTNNT